MMAGGSGSSLCRWARSVHWRKPEMGRDALAILGDGGRVVKFLEVAGTILGSGGEGLSAGSSQVLGDGRTSNPWHRGDRWR